MFTEENNRELLAFIEKMDENERNGIRFTLGDELKRELVKRLVDRDYKITGFSVQGIFAGDERPYKCWVEFSMTEDSKEDTNDER